MKIVTQLQCGALAHKFGTNTTARRRNGLLYLEITARYTRNQFHTYPSALQLPCDNEAAQLCLEHI